MKQVLPLLSIFFIAVVLSSCGTANMLSKKQDKAVSDGSIAYQPLEQPVPEVEAEKGFLGIDKEHPASKKASNSFKVLKRMKDFTKTIASTSFSKLTPERNTASKKSAMDITLGQILVVILILALLAVLVGGGLGKLINILVSLLVIVLLVLLILWLLGEV